MNFLFLRCGVAGWVEFSLWDMDLLGGLNFLFLGCGVVGWVKFSVAVCSSLVAHLAAVAAIRVRIPASCHILYIKIKPGTESGSSYNPGNKKSFFFKLLFCNILENFLFYNILAGANFLFCNISGCANFLFCK